LDDLPARQAGMIREFTTGELLFLLQAARWTVVLSLIAFVGGGAVGIVVAMLRTAPFAPLRWLMTGYIQLFQGTPLLMQLFLVYFGLGLRGLRLDPWTAVVIGFTAYASAFLGEIWRGCIQAIPAAQWEAARALALSYPVTLVFVILPQAVRIAIPPTVGFLVQIVKGTSLAAIIGFVELTRAGQLVTNATFRPMLVYCTVAAIYFALCWPLALASHALERRFGVALSHAAAAR
jgi:polar amino acid transport system permease protein